MNISDQTPAIFAVGRNYQIMLPVREPCVFWVRVGARCFYDHNNGILRSDVPVHRVTVPMELLDAAACYTVCWRTVIERKPYHSVMGEAEEQCFAFHPVKAEAPRAYLLADAHGERNLLINAANRYAAEFGTPDFYIMDGDLVNHSGAVENFAVIYELATALTHGTLPIVFARGNHDLRGVCAERFSEFTPSDNGKTYYTFRLGTVWGVVLDCGEDKDDSHPEYGHTVCCHEFRLEETAFLQRVAADAANEYSAAEVQHRMVVCHVPFNRHFAPPFDIEESVYAGWLSILNREIRPDIMICGHTHRYGIDNPQAPAGDAFSTVFPVVVGAERRIKESPYYGGAGFRLEKGRIAVVFNDGDRVTERVTLPEVRTE